MTWYPQYTISNQLLITIREIGESMGELKTQRLNKQTLAQLEREARQLSSHASTGVEGNPLSLADVKRLFKAKKEPVRDTDREVLNYNAALQKLYSAVRAKNFSVTIPLIEQVQRQVMEGLRDNPLHCGSLRQDPVLIRNPSNPDEVVFIPPDAKDVKACMQLLVDYVNDNMGTIDPIILAGIFHRQHAIIHPFMAGNGRTTRLLTSAILGRAGIDRFTMFSFENYYNRNITGYFKSVGLQGHYYDLESKIDFSDWLHYFAAGILHELQRVIKLLPQKTSQGPRLEPHHQQVLNYICEHGSITQREYGTISARSLAARKLDFEKLVNSEMVKTKGMGRGTYYILARDN